MKQRDIASRKKQKFSAEGRSSFWLGLFASLLIAQVTAAAPPNVVLIIADDLGLGDLAHQGSSFHETPALDLFASEGMRFTHAYATASVCSPSRVSILTGQAPARLDTTDWFGSGSIGKIPEAAHLEELPSSVITLAESLQAAGYETAHVGKWHLGSASPLVHGFDVNIGGFAGGSPPGGYFSPYGNPALPDGPLNEILPTRLTTEAIDWVTTHQNDPFFLHLSYYAPHVPIQTIGGLNTKYSDKLAANPVAGPHVRQDGDTLFRQTQIDSEYAGLIEMLDTEIGRLLQALDDLNLAVNTLVVFTSDQGPFAAERIGATHYDGYAPVASAAPLRGAKGWLYEGGLRIPLIARWPGIIPPATSSEVVWLADLFPTILDCVDLPLQPSDHLDGRSFRPLLEQSGMLPARDLFWHFPHYGNHNPRPSGCMHDGRYKLHEYFEDGRVELFDLLTDPNETTDLSATDLTRVGAMRLAMQTWRKEVGANPAGTAVIQPVSHFAFSVGARFDDLIGGHDASVVNAAELVDPVRGDVLSLVTAMNNAIQVPANPAFSNEDQSLSVWIKTDGLWSAPVGQIAAFQGVSNVLELVQYRATHPSFPGQIEARLNGQILRYQPNLADNQWHQLVLTITHDAGMHHTLFVDGVWAGSTPVVAAGAPTTTPSSATLVGITGASQWTGCLDDLRVYEGKLSPQQVAIHHFTERVQGGQSLASDSPTWQSIQTAVTSSNDVQLGVTRWAYTNGLSGVLGTYASTPNTVVLTDSGEGLRFLYFDADADNLPDAWENLYPGIDPTRDDAGEDFDGDGVSNFDEYLAGSNPIEQANLPHLLSYLDGQLRWSGITGRVYSVDRSPSLTTTNWLSIVSQPATNPVSQATMPQGAPKQFFRIRELP